ncbi:MAG: hypothetical protein M1540_02970 [Candidatus Bathyarchaeota archaeon]|nr:hypothetical protein [Candidatus Bathyarchaeota archaeon]
MKLSRFQPVARYFEEPQIEVGEGILVPDPKMGWTLVGPLGDKSANYDINIGIIGDASSIEATRNLIEKLNVTSYGKDRTFLHIAFPGIGKLRIRLNVKGAAQIDGESLRTQMEKSVSLSNRIELFSLIVEEKIKALLDKDPSPELLLLAYPKIVDYYCIEGAIGYRGMRRKSSLEKFIEKERRLHRPLDTFFGMPSPALEAFRPTDLRSMIKIICMKYKIPIQILRPHTTSPYNSEVPNREDDATTYWNLIVALFYKSNRLPWRVRKLMADTCYVGVSFFRDRSDPASVKTALSQVFSLDSEGYVFKGGKAITDENYTLHVTKEEASSIITQAITQYKSSKNDQLPRRVVVHKTSKYESYEIEGFKAGLSEGITLDLVAFGTRNLKLVRWGVQPPIRGTMIRLPDESVLLYTNGFIPYLGMYPGPRVPSPLEILQHLGNSPIDDICEETLALTKLNWNNAKFCTKAPITIGFAKRVGEILRNAPPDSDKYLQNRLKYYI